MQSINFTCVPHLQLCVAAFGAQLEQPCSGLDVFDLLCDQPVAAQALAIEFERYNYSTCEVYGHNEYAGDIWQVIDRPSSELAEMLQSNVPPGFKTMTAWGTHHKLPWAMYASEKIGAARNGTVVDMQRFRLNWCMLDSGKYYVCFAEWVFSQDQDTTWPGMGEGYDG